MDQPCLQCLLRGDNKDCLGGAGAETAQEVVPSILLSQDIFLHVSVGTKTTVVLGHREHQQSGVALVESEETISLDRVFDDIDGSHLVLFLEELHHSLGILSWVCAGDFDSSGNATYTPQNRQNMIEFWIISRGFC